MTREQHEPFLVGQIDLLLLALVARGPAHGYALIQRLRQESEEAFDLPEGTVYPALYRLEAQGRLRSRAQAVAGRRRRIYSITASGRKALRAREDSWRSFAHGVEAVLRGGAVPDHG